MQVNSVVRLKILPTNTYDEKKEKAYSCPKGYEKETAKRVYDSFYELKAKACQTDTNDRRQECRRIYQE